MAKSNQHECPHCAERAKRLAALEKRIGELESELAKAQKNSGNSSKPPSSDIVNPPPKRKKRGRSKKRKRGGQPGHPRHQRPLFNEHELDHIWEWRLPACPCCDGPLRDADQEPKRFQQMELETRPLCIDEHRRIGQWCAHCQKFHYPALPEGLVKAGLVGPRLTALVGWLHGVCHMSVSSIRKYFRDVIQAPISRGMLSKLMRKVSQSLQDPYDELLALLAHEDRLNVDETGHNDQGQRFWTWCFRAQLYTAFQVSSSRGSDVLLEVLGQEFDGVLGCDCRPPAGVRRSLGAGRSFRREAFGTGSGRSTFRLVPREVMVDLPLDHRPSTDEKPCFEALAARSSVGGDTAAGPETMPQPF